MSMPPAEPPDSPPPAEPPAEPASAPRAAEPPVTLAGYDVHRRFGDVRAVDGVNLEVRAGSVAALVGPNGSGKTTLLLMLAGLLSPDSGRIMVAGADPASSRLARSRIGWMPDAFGTWDSLTALEVLTTMAAAYRIPAEAGRLRARERLAMLHLDEWADRPAHTLSRGQKQRLGVARALINNPSVLLLDEPAAGLDPRSRVELRRMLRGLAAGGTTVLISSHVLSELDEMVDDAVFLSGGHTVASEPLLASTSARRQWRLRSLDGEALQGWAFEAQVPLQPDPDTPDGPGGPGGPASVLVELTGEPAAAELLASAVHAGVPVSSLAPVGGLLEQAYLSLEADRR